LDPACDCEYLRVATLALALALALHSTSGRGAYPTRCCPPPPKSHDVSRQMHGKNQYRNGTSDQGSPGVAVPDEIGSGGGAVSQAD
ncbi:hypothetical protein C8R45DRAFT_1011779, partial [Mycena sanguinolenta]